MTRRIVAALAGDHEPVRLDIKSACRRILHGKSHGPRSFRQGMGGQPGKQRPSGPLYDVPGPWAGREFCLLNVAGSSITATLSASWRRARINRVRQPQS